MPASFGPSEAVALAIFDGAPQAHAYSSVVVVLIGAHALHAAVAALACAFTGLRPAAQPIAALFTHFAAATGIAVIAVVVLFPGVQ